MLQPPVTYGMKKYRQSDIIHSVDPLLIFNIIQESHSAEQCKEIHFPQRAVTAVNRIAVKGDSVKWQKIGRLVIFLRIVCYQNVTEVV